MLTPSRPSLSLSITTCRTFPLPPLPFPPSARALLHSQPLFRPSPPAPISLNKPSSPPPPRPKLILRYASNPSELNIRVQHLCARPTGGLDAAIELVRSSSIHVATVSVWTQLLQHVVDSKRFSLVYRLFLDLKRRQIPPDTPFFVVLFASLARCPPSKSVSLARLRAIWGQATRDRPAPLALTNAYLHCLATHGFVDEAFAFFERLPPTAIDSVTLSQLLKPLLDAPTPEALRRARELLARARTAGAAPLDTRASLSFASLFLKSPERADQQLGAALLRDRLGLELEHPTYRFWAKAKGPLPEPGQTAARLGAGELTTLLRMLLGLRKFALVRRLWVQIVANRDLYLEREALDQLHCGLAMVAMGECGAIGEVEALLAWMINSGDKQLVPNSDTLDKAMQAAWQAEDLSAAIRILATLTRQYAGLVRPSSPDQSNALIVLSRAQDKGRVPPVRPSNRALSTLLQTAGKAGTTSHIDRALEVAERLGRRLPEKPTSSASAPNARLLTNTSTARFELYWEKQYLWVLTDLLDRMASRPESSLSSARRQALADWRMQVDAELARSGDLEMRSRIERREEERQVRRADEGQRRAKSVRKRSAGWTRANGDGGAKSIGQ